MKSTLIMAIGLALVFVGCQPKVQNLNVKQEHSEVSSEDCDIRIDRSVFSAADETINKSCMVLNGKIEKLVNDLKDSLRADATELFQTFADKPDERPNWKYELIVDDSVFMATDQFISVRLRVYSFTGGAHGMTTYHSFNYDVKNQKFLTNKEILNYANAAQINTLLKANFKNPDGCFTMEPTLDLAGAINFNATSVYFLYGQYVLGAYACGSAEVVVPRAALKGDILIK
ncbi:DUF4163 domain-containing protein [uncultured Butyricimonas sp.]|uniref:DUF4163 domain-containing protein n=1 Tax=uncultured Butyricimonas sp. TaxID=1268785 RepID=UPI0026DD036E|nr:DUF4163 domain-containing protein [uncultured Butyricimonas sp.]